MNIGTLLLVFVGGAAGSVLRWGVGRAVGERYHGRFPLGTFIINVSGGFVMGLLSTVLNVDWRSRFDSSLAALVLTGLLGGYTTFSSYQLDTVTLSNKQAHTLAAVYWAGSVAAGLAAAALGAMLAGMMA